MIRSIPPADCSTARRERDPVAMCAADEAYAMPLAVTLRSAGDHLAAGARLTVYLVDLGISESSWTGLKETVADLPLELIRVPYDAGTLRHLQTSHHISHAAYARLLAAEILPSHLSRVIYLDSDLLIQDDLGCLWNAPLEGAWCLAVPDIACPHVDARRADCNFRRSSPFLATICPIRNWRQLELNPQDHYFNSGVLVIDLGAWRRESLGERFLQCLDDHQQHVWCWDQYALNVVLAGRWRALPLRWNLGTHAFEYPNPRHAPMDAGEFESACRAPSAIHFTTEFKPWLYGSRHPRKRDFFQALGTTAWRDWTPQRPAWSWRSRWDRCGLFWQMRWTVASRKLRAALLPPRGSARSTVPPAAVAAGSRHDDTERRSATVTAGQVPAVGDWS
jgi:lipopolysaccharide biosynthesis glycosyltransferase